MKIDENRRNEKQINKESTINKIIILLHCITLANFMHNNVPGIYMISHY